MLFFIKALLLTIVFVVLLQVKVSGITLEVHATRFITTSMITEPIRYTAQTGAKVIQSSVAWVSNKINSTMKWGRSEQRSNFRTSPFKLNRSDSYEKQREAAGEAASEATSFSH